MLRGTTLLHDTSVMHSPARSCLSPFTAGSSVLTYTGALPFSQPLKGQFTICFRLPCTLRQLSVFPHPATTPSHCVCLHYYFIFDVVNLTTAKQPPQGAILINFLDLFYYIGIGKTLLSLPAAWWKTETALHGSRRNDPA